MTKTDKRVSCDVCGQEVNPRGLYAHKRLKHGVMNSQAVTEDKAKKSNVEVRKMDGCIDCLKKDQEKAFADRDHKSEVEKLTARAQTAESRADAAAKDLERAAEAAKNQEPPAQQWPDVDTFVEHCKTCDTHKPQLRQFMDKVMGAMSPDEVKAQMKRLNIEEAPERIILTGLGRREARR